MLTFRIRATFLKPKYPRISACEEVCSHKKISKIVLLLLGLLSSMTLQDMRGQFLGQCFTKLTLVGCGLIVAVCVHHSSFGPYVPLWLLSWA